MPSSFKQRYKQSDKFEFIDASIESEDAITQLIAGLRQAQKTIAPKFFYDEVGSDLFTRITKTEEYYPTRTEIGLLARYGNDIARCIGERSLLLEYGSGSSEKIRILLDSLKPLIYAPLDISRDYLEDSALAISQDYPWLQVIATCVDYTRDFELSFDLLEHTVGFFPGSSIGNFDRDLAREFLMRVREQLGSTGGLLIGVDLKKDRETLERAYNDATGVTEAFNLNVLTHINREYGSDFDVDSFQHLANYNSELGCIQMFLKSTREQIVTLGSEKFSLARGELIHTENSFKYSEEEFLQMAQRAGFENNRVWRDENNWFAVIYLQ